MKKLMALALALVLALSLAGCGGQQADTGTTSNTEAPVESAAAESEDADSAQETAAATAEDASAELADFEEITVVDNDQCTIRITGLDPDNLWGYTINAYMENKSSDKNYMFSLASIAVNGVQTVSTFASEIPAGKMENEEIRISSDLESYGVGDFTDIELFFTVYDTDDWTADSVAEETVHIYPYGEEQATVFTRESQDTDTVLVDNESVSVIVTGYEPEGFWGYTVDLYLVNKTENELIYTVDQVSVNGYMVDPFWATTLGAGNVAFSSLYWFDSDFEENGITDVEEIEMELIIYNSEDWLADPVYDEVVTLKP